MVHGTIHSNNWIFSSDSVVQQVESNPPIQQSGNAIKIGYNLSDDLKRRVSISYEITVPPDTTLAAHSGSGNIEAIGMRSGVDAETCSGDIRVQDTGTRTRVHTGSGNTGRKT